MKAHIPATVFAALFLLSACSEPAAPPAPASKSAAEPAPAPAEPSFVNKVWAVAESKQVEAGSLRVFLSEGTLVMASPNAKPAFGSWSQQDGRLKITEEGLTYDADILELTESSLRIRMHSPGEPVEIRFEPANQELMAGTAAAAAFGLETTVSAAPPVALWGTAWRLTNLAGVGVMDRVPATLAFPSEGRASGNGSCNRFNGVVTVDRGTIHFGGIAATRKACPEAVMNQEEAYFAALRDAERFESDGQTLSIFATDRTEPLRFVATEAQVASPANQISRASGPAAAMPQLTGIWTVVAHHSPGVAAQNDDAARSRYGESLRLTSGAAVSSGNRCGEPRYAARSEPAEAWLASEYKLAAGSLPPLGRRQQVRLMDVSCGGTPWAALGGRLIEVDRDRALAPWDGVFFELARDRDFRALGQEPGWNLEIRQGAEMRFTYDYGKGSAVTPAAHKLVDPGTGTRSYHARTGANDLRVEIVPVTCTDSMSGRPFPSTVSVTLNGKTYRGCGEELATPYQG